MEDISKIVLGTGSYCNVKSGNTVSITGDGGNAWEYYGASYKKLAPLLVTYTPYAEKYQELLKLKQDTSKIKEYLEYRYMIEEEYIKSYYETRLMNIDVIELLNILYNRFGNDIILLCHENIKEFCHRRLIADYIEIKTGIYIPEVSVDDNGNIIKELPIRYKKRLLKQINK